MLMHSTVADVTFPTWVVVSQWILLLGLSGLIIVLYRQLAYVIRLRDMGSERDGLPVGESAPAFAYTPVTADSESDMRKSTPQPVRFEPLGHWSLLLFADPGCVSCRGAVEALGRVGPKLPQISQVLVVTHSEPALIAAVDAFSRASIPVGRI